VFVERARAAQAAIRANIAALSATDMTLFPGEAASFAASPGEAFDLVVADPPYAEPAEALAEALRRLHAGGRLRPGADVVIERSVRAGEFTWPEGLKELRTRRYGDTLVCYGHAV
jgi:16S rRNA (guanine966-N2)-methyltransferase